MEYARHAFYASRNAIIFLISSVSFYLFTLPVIFPGRALELMRAAVLMLSRLYCISLFYFIKFMAKCVVYVAFVLFNIAIRMLRRVYDSCFSRTLLFTLVFLCDECETLWLYYCLISYSITIFLALMMPIISNFSFRFQRFFYWFREYRISV